MQGQWYTLGLDVSGFGSGISSAVGMLGRFGLAVDGIRSAISIGKGLIDTFSKPVKLAAEFESTQGAIQTMVGDLKVGNALLAQIEKYADSTSFEFPELAQTTQLLLAMGTAAGDVRGEIGMMGDLAAGLRQPIESIALVWGQARASGQLMGGDMLQLTSKGIPVYKLLGEILGKDVAEVKKMGEAGQLTFPLLQEAFRRLTSEGGQFYQMTKKQASTTLGLWSTLTDGVNKLYRQLGEPINDILRPMMKEVNEKYLPQMSDKFALVMATMKQSAAEGKLGQLIQDSAIYGLAKAGNFAEGLFNWLPDVLRWGLEKVANTFNGTFSTNGLSMVANLGMGLLKALQAAGDFVASALGEPFRRIGAGFQASLELAGNVILDALGKLDPSLKKTFDQLYADAYEANAPKAKGEDGKDNLKEAGERLKQSVKDAIQVGKDVAAQGDMPEFKMGTSFDKELRLSGDRIAIAGKAGQAQLDANKKANEGAAKALEKTKTSAEDAAKALENAKQAAAGAADADKKKSGGTKEYKSWREQRADALADRRAQIAARSSKGFSYTDQFKPRGSSLDYLKGEGLTTGHTGPSLLDRYNGKDHPKSSALTFGRRIGRRGQQVANGIAQEGAQNRAAAKANQAQAANGNAGNTLDRIERGITTLVSAVQGLEKKLDSAIGVA
jgi:tape measure domain-containing protein